MIQVIFILMMFFNALYAGPRQKNKEKKYNLSICAVFKNEKKYLKEWIEYHRLVGVDHFYLYNNNSLDRPITVLDPYIKQGVVTLISWPDYLRSNNDEFWALSTQVTAYENAAKFRALNQTKWLVFIEIDEFLLPVQGMKITDILAKYDQYPGVILSRDFYDAGKINEIPKKKLTIENTSRIGTPHENICRSVEKTIFKPELCRSFRWPPFKYNFVGDQTPIRISKYEMRINNYINRNIAFLDPAKLRKNIGSEKVSGEEFNDLLEKGYEVEDPEKAIYRYVPEMLKKMGFQPNWN